MKSMSRATKSMSTKSAKAGGGSPHTHKRVVWGGVISEASCLTTRPGSICEFCPEALDDRSCVGKGQLSELRECHRSFFLVDVERLL